MTTHTEPASLVQYQSWARDEGIVFPDLRVVLFDEVWGCGGWATRPLLVEIIFIYIHLYLLLYCVFKKIYFDVFGVNIG